MNKELTEYKGFFRRVFLLHEQDKLMIKKFIDKVFRADVIDILKQLPDNCIDMGVTSPPYNKRENKKGWLVNKVIYSGATDNLPEDIYQKTQIEVLNELYRIIKEGGSFFYNHKIRWERGCMLHPMDWLRKTKWTIRQEMIWDRMIAGNIRGWRFTPENNNPHPAPFPLALPLRAIYSIMDERQGGIIIDPYCGSGTTLVAAKILCHHYIGIDISEEYVKYAKQRLNNYEQEIKTAMDELSKHVVIKTFKERKAKGEFVGKYRKDIKTNKAIPLFKHLTLFNKTQ